MKDFSALRQKIADNKVPEALEAFGVLFAPANKDLGPFGEYVCAVDGFGRLLRKRNQLKNYHQSFETAAESLSRTGNYSGQIPYFIKSSLIAASIMKRWSKNPSEGFAKLAQKSSGSEKGIGMETHNFLDSGTFEGRAKYREERSPAYHDLHYKAKEMPFVAWSIRYLRSKKRGSVSRETSSV